MKAYVLAALICAGIAASDYFLHITDQHFDWRYVEGSDPTQKKCHSNNKGTDKAGHYGHFRCQSPEALVLETTRQIAKLFPQPQFILWTGDMRVGIDTIKGKDEVLGGIKNTTAIMKKYFPNTPIYPVFGNHDVYPNYQHSPKNKWLYEYAADQWKSWLPADATASLRQNGYYHARIAGDYNIVALNTCYYQVKAINMTNVTDPGNMVKWMDQTLTKIAGYGEKAYVIAHCYEHPRDLRPEQNELWTEQLRKHASTIEASFFGHAHTDFFQLIYDKKGYRNTAAKPVGVGYVAPSITPEPGGPHNHHPGFRVYRRKAGSMQINSHETYWMNLTLANTKGITDFKLEYTTKDGKVPELDVASPLTPEGWHKVLQNLATAKDDLFWKWRQRYAVMNLYTTDKCDNACKWPLLCIIQYGGDAQAYEKCRSSGL